MKSMNWTHTAAVVLLCCFSANIAAEPTTCYITSNSTTTNITVVEQCSEAWECEQTDGCTDLGNITLIVHKTTLTGDASQVTLPLEVVSFSAISAGLSGSLPSLHNLTGLTHLNLSSNNFSGSLPEAWSQLTALKILRLENNPGLTGSIPESWSALKNMRLLSLLGNREMNISTIPPNWSPSKVRVQIEQPSPPPPKSPPAPTRTTAQPPTKTKYPPPAYPTPITFSSPPNNRSSNMSLEDMPLAKARGAGDPRNERVFRFLAIVAGGCVVAVILGVAAFILAKHILAQKKQKQAVSLSKKKPVVEADVQSVQKV